MTLRWLSHAPLALIQGADDSGAWTVRLGGRRLSLGRSGTLLVSRVWEQAVLGLASITLAWRLGVHAFVPVSALLIANSLAVVASDFGLGTDLLHRPRGAFSVQAVQRLRVRNCAISAAALGACVCSPGVWRTVMLAVAAIWVASGEAFLRKSALTRIGRAHRSAGAEMVGSGGLAVMVAAAIAVPHDAVAILGCGLVLKHVSECWWSRGWREAFDDDGSDRWDLSVWMSGVITYAVANVDFIVVAVLISGPAFSVYSLGFRVAAVVASQLSYVVARIALVDFAESPTDDVYRRRLDQLLGAGICAAVLTVVAAPAIPAVLGASWRPSVGVVIVLAMALPWRMCLGIGGMAVIAKGDARVLARWEGARLAIVTLVLAGLATLGFPWFVGGVGVVAIVTGVAYDRFAVARTGAQSNPWIRRLAPIAMALVAFAALFVNTPR